MTKRKKYIRIKTLHHLLPVLLMLLFTLQGSAQFVKINLNIPAKTSMEGLETLYLTPDINEQYLSGTAAFSISAAENIQVQVNAKQVETKENQLPLSTKLAWRNNGSRNIPNNRQFIKNTITFPMLGTEQIIDKKENYEALFNAWIFINVQGKIQATNKQNKKEFIELKIEYN